MRFPHITLQKEERLSALRKLVQLITGSSLAESIMEPATHSTRFSQFWAPLSKDALPRNNPGLETLVQENLKVIQDVGGDINLCEFADNGRIKLLDGSGQVIDKVSQAKDLCVFVKVVSQVSKEKLNPKSDYPVPVSLQQSADQLGQCLREAFCVDESLIQEAVNSFVEAEKTAVMMSEIYRSFDCTDEQIKSVERNWTIGCYVGSALALGVFGTLGGYVLTALLPFFAPGAIFGVILCLGATVFIPMTLLGEKQSEIARMKMLKEILHQDEFKEFFEDAAPYVGVDLMNEGNFLDFVKLYQAQQGGGDKEEITRLREKCKMRHE